VWLVLATIDNIPADLMATARAVLIRAFCENLSGNSWRQVGQLFLLCAVHFLKQARQKLCWHGACDDNAKRCKRVYRIVGRMTADDY
jgi:hypothetical protein